MNIYWLHQSKVRGYDTYDSAVVAAESEEAARLIHPCGESTWTSDGEWREGTSTWDNYTWAAPGDVTVRFLGIAADGVEAGVICASFNAG